MGYRGKHKDVPKGKIHKTCFLEYQNSSRTHSNCQNPFSSA